MAQIMELHGHKLILMTDSGIEAKNLETYTYETDVQKVFSTF